MLTSHVRVTNVDDVALNGFQGRKDIKQSNVQNVVQFIGISQGLGVGKRRIKHLSHDVRK